MKTLTIAWTYLKRTFASRSVWLFTVLMPILFTWVLAVAMGGLGGDDASQRIPLLVANRDASFWSGALLRLLEDDPTLEVVPVPAGEIPNRIRQGEAAAGLVIPPGFGAALEDGASPALPFLRSATQALAAQVAGQRVLGALVTLHSLGTAQRLALVTADRLGLPAEGAGLAERALALALAEPPIAVEVTPVTRLEARPIPLGAAQSSPGMAVMYVLFLTIGGGATLLAEREKGTLARLLVLPVRKADILGGHLLGIYLSALAQLTLMVLFGRFALGVNWGASPAGLALMLLTYAFAATALGVLLAALARTAAQVGALSTLVGMSLGALGGCWWPIEIVPPWMQTLAHALPTYWAMQGFHDLISRGLDWPAVLPEAGALTAFGALFLAVALWRFRWE